MKRYCLGFAIATDGSDPPDVLLIKKEKPDWQRGFLNGLGGTVEGWETPQIAMAREFQEECGVQTRAEDWSRFAELSFSDSTVVCYCLNLNQALFWSAHTKTNEEIRHVRVSYVASPAAKVLPNLRWLIPMACYKLSHPQACPLVIKEL